MLHLTFLDAPQTEMDSLGSPSDVSDVLAEFCAAAGRRTAGRGRFDLQHVFLPFHPFLEKRLQPAISMAWAQREPESIVGK